MMAPEQAPIPYRRGKGIRRRLGAAGWAIAGYTAFFVVAMSLFGTLVFLSLLP